MKIITKIFSDRFRVGAIIICLIVITMMITSLIIKDTFALDNSSTGIKNLKYYNQGNYSSVKYCSGDYNVQKNGCGAVSLAMMASTFTSSKYDPKYVANWICEHGHTGGGTPTKFFTMEEMLEDFSLDVETLFKKDGKGKGDAGQTYSTTEGSAILNAVKQGRGIILYIPGHYVAIGPNEECSNNEVYFYNVGRMADNGCYTTKELFKATYNYKNRCTDNGNCGWKAAFAYKGKSTSEFKVRVYFNANGAQLGNDSYYLDSSNNIRQVSNSNKYYKEYGYNDKDIDLLNYNGTTFKMSYEGYKNASPFWNTKADGSGESFYQTKEIHDAKELCDASNSDCSITLYGQWKPIEYQIHYVGNGNTGETYTTGHCSSSGKCGLDVYTSGTKYDNATSTFKHSAKYDYDTEVTLRKNRFVREGYTFIGWATSASGNVKYSNQDVVTNLTTIDGGIVSLYAKWKTNTYTIKYDGNGSDSGTTANSIHEYNVRKALTTNAYTRNGYTFIGWNTMPDGSGVSYNDGQIVKDLSLDNASSTVKGLTANNKSPIVKYLSLNNASPIVKSLLLNDDSSLTLYAQWVDENDVNDSNEEIITYYVKYDSNDGIGTMSNSTHIYNKASDLNYNIFTRDNYIFAGWNTKADGTGISYLDGQTISNLTSTNGTTVTLYAQWIKEETEEEDKTKVESDNIDNNTGEEFEENPEYEIIDAEEEPGDAEDSNLKGIDNPDTGDLVNILVIFIGIGSIACFIYYYKKIKI